MATDIARVQIVGEDRTGPAFTSAKRNLEGIASSAKRTQTEVGNLAGAYGRLDRGISAIRTASALGGLVGVGILGAAIREASEAERAVNQLNAALRSTGNVAGLTSRSMQSFADELAAVSNFDDDELVRGMTTLVRFRTVSGDAFREASRLAVDLAAATGTDLAAAFEKIGRATADPISGIRGLREAGVVLNDTQQELIKNLVRTGDTAKAQAVVFAELQKAVGGTASSDTQGLGGSLARLSKSWNNLLEDFGDSKLIQGAINGLAEMLDFAQRLDERLGSLLGKTGGASGDKNLLIDLLAEQKAADQARMAQLQQRLDKSNADLAEIEQIQKRLAQIQSASNQAFIAGLKPIQDASEAYKKYQESLRQTSDTLQKDTGVQRHAKQLSELLDQYIKLEVAAARATTSMTQEQAESLAISIGNRESPRVSQAARGIISAEGRKEAEAALDQLRQQLHAARGEGDAFYDSISRIVAKLPEMEGRQFLDNANELRERIRGIEAEKQAQEDLIRKEQERAQQREALIASFRAEAEAMQRTIQLGEQASASERLRYEIVQGRFQALDEVQKDELLRLSEVIEKNEEIIRQEKEKADAAEKRRRAEEEYDNRLQRLRSNTPSGRQASQNADVEFAKDALSRGKITVKQYEEILESIEKTRDGGKDAFRELESFIRSWSARSTDAIVDFTFGVETSFRDMVNEVLRDLARLVIQKTVTQPLFDGLSSILGGGGSGGDGGVLGDVIAKTGSIIFGGGMAGGGNVQAGRMYRVGELGPETFIPRVAGSIVPNGGATGSITTHINVSVNNSGQTTSSSNGQDGNRLARALEQGVRDVLVKEMRSGGMLATR